MVNSAAVRVQLFAWTSVFNYFECIHRKGIAESCGNSRSNFLRKGDLTLGSSFYDNSRGCPLSAKPGARALLFRELCMLSSWSYSFLTMLHPVQVAHPVLQLLAQGWPSASGPYSSETQHPLGWAAYPTLEFGKSTTGMREKSRMVKWAVPAIPGKWILVEVLGMKVRAGKGSTGRLWSQGRCKTGYREKLRQPTR